ncbi:metal ABC transporter substrate-binding protein [Chloroflexota bacterium]
MKNNGVIPGVFIIILALSLVFGLIPGGCAPAETSRLKVVTTTSLLTYITEQVGGDKVEVVNIIMPVQHPGDFDAKPADIQKLADADLFLWHNWPGEVFVPGLIESADNPGLNVVAVEIQGNWMTPQVQMEAANKVAAALSRVDSLNSDVYEQGADTYRDAVSAKEAEIRVKLVEADVSGIKVLVSFWQAGFAGWAGLDVIGTYGPARLTIDATRELVEKGREVGVTLVIDNLQSGRDAGKAVAGEIGAARVILSNFPGGYQAGGTWQEEIDYNIELILEAVSR